MYGSLKSHFFSKEIKSTIYCSGADLGFSRGGGGGLDFQKKF